MAEVRLVTASASAVWALFSFWKVFGSPPFSGCAVITFHVSFDVFDVGKQAGKR